MEREVRKEGDAEISWIDLIYEIFGHTQQPPEFVMSAQCAKPLVSTSTTTNPAGMTHSHATNWQQSQDTYHLKMLLGSCQRRIL